MIDTNNRAAEYGEDPLGSRVVRIFAHPWTIVLHPSGAQERRDANEKGSRTSRALHRYAGQMGYTVDKTEAMISR